MNGCRKRSTHHPRCVGDHFVNIAAVAQCLVALLVRHDCAALLLVCDLVAAHLNPKKKKEKKKEKKKKKKKKKERKKKEKKE